jgi:DNA-binding response OmpR family regulator
MDLPDPADAADRPTCTVLCIEDHPIHLELIEAILSRHPSIRLFTAGNGRDGVRVALEHAPDLLLLDMNLPDIGGVEVVRELSLLIAQRAMRVVLLTAEPFSIDVVKALSLGAHDYWQKPLDIERVSRELGRLLDDIAGDPTGPGGARSA